MQNIICDLTAINGTDVEITIRHKLYGIQHLECIFNVYIDSSNIGFYIHKQHICCPINDIVEYISDGKSYTIIGNTISMNITSKK